MFPYFSWLIFMLMCIYFHSEVIIKRVSENFVLVLFLGWNTCNWNMIASILCILDLSWTAKADLMAPVCSGGFQWFFLIIICYLNFVLSWLLSLIFERVLYGSSFRYLRSTLFEAVSACTPVLPAVHAGPTLIWVFKVSTCSVGLRKHQVCFLKLAAASFEDAEKLFFLLESQTEEDLIVVIQPWISTDTFWWAELFLVLRRKFWGNGFFFSGPLSMHASTITVLQKQDERGESFQNWRGLSSVLAADFFDL